MITLSLLYNLSTDTSRVDEDVLMQWFNKDQHDKIGETPKNFTKDLRTTLSNMGWNTDVFRTVNHCYVVIITF